MQDFLAIMESVPTASWVFLALGTLIPFPVAIYQHVRRRYYTRKFERRVEQDASTFHDELAAYELAVDEEPKEVDLVKLTGDSLVAGFLGALSLWAGEMKGLWPVIVMLAVVGLGFGYTRWRKANDPPAGDDADAYDGPPEISLPREAVTGFLAAMLFIGGVVALIWFFNNLY